MESFYELKTILKLKSIHCIDHLIIQKLEKAGIKLSLHSNCHTRKSRNSVSKSMFGVPLEAETQQDEVYVIDDHTASLPKFFVMAVSFLNSHVTCEGIFRKAGSVNRQKTLRAALNAGQILPDSTSPHDVAALLKQYLRELPDPLFTNRLFPVFAEIMRSTQLSIADREELLLMACLLLSERHLLCLKALMQLLQKIAICSDSHSLMDSQSLALVLSPNIAPVFVGGHGSSSKEAVCLDVKITCDITKVLIERANDICSRLPVGLFSGTSAAGETKHDSHTPWKGYVSDKIRGTWTKIRGKGPPLGYPKSDEDCSLSKRPALEEESDDAIIGTPSVFGTARRQRKKKSYRKKRGFTHFRTPFTTPAKQLNTATRLTAPFTVDHLRGPLCDNYTVGESEGSPGIQEKRVSSPLGTRLSEPVMTVSQPTVVSNVTIGQRVRKRRQNERNITLSCSTECISASQTNDKLPVSQSDSRLFKGTTPIASSSHRPLLKAMLGKVKNCEKRKGFIHEPGIDVQTCTISKKKRKYKLQNNDENVHLISSDDDINKHSFSGKDSEAKATDSLTNGEGGYTDNSSSTLYKTPPIFKSPGLLRKVASEITERFQFTPKQLAPMLNINDSYLFAVEESDTPDTCKYKNLSPLMNPKKGPLKTRSPDTDAYTLNTNQESYCLSTYKPTTPTLKHDPYFSIASNTRSKSKSVAKTRSSPFFSTKSKCQSGKLSRRAKQYLVHPDHPEQHHFQQRNDTNKQKMLVSEWIL